MLKHKIVVGDSRDMSEVSDKSVQLIVTSPPYWQIKDYGSDNQIGFNDSYEDYINNLNLVWQECFRVLEDGCKLCINIGDQYARSTEYGRYKVIPINVEIIRFCEALGFDYMGSIIWQKITNTKSSGGGVFMGSYPYPRNGIVSLDYEYILLFKKKGKAKKPDTVQKSLSELTQEEWQSYFTGHWTFSGEKQNDHIAKFPLELPNRLIKMFSFVGDTVLDPFLGSGTTALACKNLERNSIGYEINNEYIEIMSEKLCIDSVDVMSNGSNHYEIVSQQTEIDLGERYKKLPYIFNDYVKLKRIERKEVESKKEEIFKVKEVVSPEEILLCNREVVRLIGVKTIESKSIEAVDFLRNKLKGMKVYYKTDSLLSDDNIKYAYLYLENKTFVNAHLLKTGLVEVDKVGCYKMKDKFIKIVK